MHICFTSNGYGEDRAAAQIASELRALRPDFTVSAVTLLTAGEEFARRDIPLLYQGKMPPSGGFPLMSVCGLARDLTFLPCQYNELRQLQRRENDVDLTVAVGDLCLLLISRKLFGKPTIFLALSKSEYKRRYSCFELALLRKLASPVLTRDSFTLERLRHWRINSSHLGNPLMDGLTPNGIKFINAPLLGLLPGSREEAYGNFRRICRVVSDLPVGLGIACALPPSLDVTRIRDIVASDGWSGDSEAIYNGTHTIQLLRNGFEDVISAAKVIIGLAGTANEQAAGLGKPVVSFVGCGPQTTRRRMLDQQRLLGGTAKFVADYPHGVVREVCELLIMLTFELYVVKWVCRIWAKLVVRARLPNI